MYIINRLIKVSIIMIITLSFTANAYDFGVNGIYYNIISEDDKTVEVIYKGGGDQYEGSIEIPESITYNGINYTVTTIGYNAFWWCKNLTSIAIPESVTVIGDGAFDGCNKLAEFKLPKNLTYIGRNAFEGCSLFTKFEIPTTVINIGGNAFHETGWYNTQPDGLLYLNNWCVGYKGMIGDFTIKSGTKYLCDLLFEDCESLKSISIPNSIIKIGKRTFYGCSSLTTIYIPDSVTSIGEYAFDGCHNLKNVYINNLSAWCNIDFEDGVANPLYPARETNLYINDKLITHLVIPDNVSHIKPYAFYGWGGLKDLTIGNSVTSIGDDAFGFCDEDGLNVHIFDLAAWCNIDFEEASANPLFDTYMEGGTNLYINDKLITHLVIPDNISHIKPYAFYAWHGLKDLTIGNSVTSIGDEAFGGCKGLTNLTIGNSVTSIGNDAFDNCDSLTNVYICNLKQFCEIDYGDLKSDVYYENPFGYPDNLYLNNELIENLNIPEDVTEIPKTLFGGLDCIKSVNIPNSVIIIDKDAFRSCDKLMTIQIGKSLKLIGEDAFEYCDNIKKIEIKAHQAPIIENEEQFSEDVYKKADLFVPSGCEDNYKYAYGWSEFQNIKGYVFSEVKEIINTTNINVNIYDNNIMLNNVPIDCLITVYNISGQIISSTKALNNNVTITVPSYGIYFVSVGTEMIKVFVN